MVVPRCCPEASSELDANTTALVEIVLLDSASRPKSGAGAGSRSRMTTKNMTMWGTLFSEGWANLSYSSETAEGLVWLSVVIVGRDHRQWRRQRHQF